MKIEIGDQYKSDEENDGKYTIDENGNVNLFINIDAATTEYSKTNNELDDNIQDNENEKIIESNFEEVNEEVNYDEIKNEEEFSQIPDTDEILKISDTKEFLEFSEVKEYGNTPELKRNNTIERFNDEYEIEAIGLNEVDKRFSEVYNSIYSERYDDSEKKYSNRFDEKIEEKSENVFNKRVNGKDERLYNEGIENNNKRLYKEKVEDKNEGVYNQQAQLKNTRIFDERINEKVEEKGRIDILCRLGGKEGVELKGARINIYLLNGVSPKLYDSKFSDGEGKVIFSNLPNGCYRIISIVDRRFFEKPAYYNWNEVTIDSNSKKANIVIVNKLKAGYYKRQY